MEKRFGCFQEDIWMVNREMKKIPGFQLKMVEQKDVCSSPPVRAPKLQIAVKQPSTGGRWNPPNKDAPRPGTRSCRETAEGHSHNKSKSHIHQVGDP